MRLQIECPALEVGVEVRGLGNSDTYYNMDGPYGCEAKLNKPVTKRKILYDFTYM
jgi:hypothetical protein